MIGLLKKLVSTETVSGMTVAKGPLASQRNWLAAILFPLLVVANRRWNLGLTDHDLLVLAGVLGALVLGKSAEDAMKRSAAIKGSK